MLGRDALLFATVPHRGGDVEALDAELRTVERGVDLLALAAPLPLPQRHHHPVGGDDRAHVVGEGDADGQRAALGGAGDRHDAAARLREDVHRAHEGLGVGPQVPPAGGAGDDDARVALRHYLVREVEPLQHAGAHVVVEDVGALHQLQQHLATALVAQVQADRALVAVEVLEVGPQPVGREAGAGDGAAAGVGIVRRFDLDHVGAHVREHGGGVGALLEDGHVEDADTFERERHSESSLSPSDTTHVVLVRVSYCPCASDGVSTTIGDGTARGARDEDESRHQ